MTKARDLADLGAYDTIDVTATGLVVNRATTDGSILDLQKDGATVGSIGSYAGELNLGSGNTRLTYNDTSSIIYPVNAASQFRDAAVDLGYSGSRFKDFYISGGVYLGGTGAANYLDDYEEGTWTPELSGVVLTVAIGTYTKIGDLVTCTFQINSSGMTDSNVANLSGFPFTNIDENSDGRSAGYLAYNASGTSYTLLFSGGTSEVQFRGDPSGDAANRTAISGNTFWGTIIYRAA